MTRDSLLRMGLRTIAVGIAIAALIDPSIATRRSTKPAVVVLAADSAKDLSAANGVARVIAKSYTVSRTVLSGAAATVIVGRALPSAPISLDVPAFAVTPSGESIAIESLVAPTTSPALARVRIGATIRATGARGKSIDIALRDGSVAVDHVSRRIGRDDDTLAVALTFVPATSGVQSLRIVAHIDGTSDAIADASVDVHERKWAVLFYDPRPSWMSTFVRRAIERDPRFVATSRVVTSRDIDTDAGNPPGRLDDLVALSLFDAVVVGAPQAMSANDAAGLEAFMRRRGGNVVLLLDESGPGPHDRLMAVPAFTSATQNQPAALTSAEYDSLRLQATTMAWPTALPPGARVVAGGAHPVVWQEPVGAGNLVVSGAFDAWRFRDPAASSFDAFWQTTIADAASATAAPIIVTTSRSIVAPGERFDVDATLRDEAIDAGRRAAGPLQVRASLGASADTGTAIAIWPRAAGHLVARVHAPVAPGVYQVALSVGDRRASTPIVVATNPRRVELGAESRLRDWVRATGGETLNASDIARLPELLGKAIRIEPQLTTWHPLRSAWWIVPFVAALGGEWWLRRRRGLP
jgi:hypothetical protein